MANYFEDYKILEYLTDYASGSGNTWENGMMSKISPVVPVQGSIAIYRQWDITSNIAVSNITQPYGERPREITPRGKDVTVALQTFGLSSQIYDQMLSDDRQESQLNSLAVYKNLESNMATSYELEQFQRLYGNLPTDCKPTAVGGVTLGSWSTDTVDPVEQLDAVFEYINNRSCRMPNKVVMGLGAFNILRANPIAQKKYQFNPENIVTADRIKASLLNTNCAVEVATMPKALADGTFASIMDNAVFVLFVEPTPSQFDASAVKSFMRGGDRRKSIISDRDELARSTTIGISFDAAPAIITNPNALIYINAAGANA